MKKIRASTALILLLTLLGTLAHAADSASFNPLPVSVRSSGAIPVGTVVVWAVAANPADMSKWLECNGQVIDAAKYPELRGLVGANVPDYRNQFLRGGTAAQAGTQVADSTRSHAHAMDQHSHTVSGTAGAQYYSANVGSQSVSGWANGQAYSNSGGTNEKVRLLYKTGTAEHGPGTVDIYQNVQKEVCVPDWLGIMPLGCIDFPSGSGTTAYTSGSAISGQTSGTSVSGWTGGSNISGYTSLAGPSATQASGGAETAPVHTRIRYLIRALP